jgi:hypothetical protein
MSKIYRILVAGLSALAPRVVESTFGLARLASLLPMGSPPSWVDSEAAAAIVNLCEVERSPTGHLRFQEVQFCVHDIFFIACIIPINITCDGVNVQLIVPPSIHSL